MAKCGKCGAIVSDSSGTCYSCGATFSNDDLISVILGIAFSVSIWVFMYLPFALVGAYMGYKVYDAWGWGWVGCSIVGLLSFGVLYMMVYTIGVLSRLAPKPLNYLVRFFQFIVVSGLQMIIAFAISINIFMPASTQTQFKVDGEAAVNQLKSEGVDVDKTTSYLFVYAKSQLSTAKTVVRGEHTQESKKALIYSSLITLAVGLFVWLAYRRKNDDRLDED